jgi:ABC-type uncharacterized transport system permease subunit
MAGTRRVLALGRQLLPLWDIGAALVIALAISMLFLVAGGYPAVGALRSAFGYALFTAHGLITTLAYSIPLIFTGLCFLVGVRAGVFNVGAEGVVMVSAGAAVAVGGLLDLPRAVHLPLVVAVSMATGLIWMLPSAILKIRRGVHEVLSTIMLNWIALYLLAFLIAYPLRDRDFPARTLVVRPTARLGALVPETSLTVMLFAGVLAAVGFYFLLYHTPTGLRMRASGANPAAAYNAGVDVDRSTLLAFLLGGSVAGLGGFALTAGFPPYWYIDEHMQSLVRIGYSGIVVSAMARDHPLGLVFTAILFGAVLTSRTYLQFFHGVVFEFADLLAGIIVMLLAIPGISREVLRWRARQVARRRLLTPATTEIDPPESR